MKVLQILPSLEVGGVERGVIDLVRAMKKRGEDSVVISSGGPLVNELQKMGIPHYQLAVNKKSLFSLRLIPRMVEIIRKERIDVVHARSRVPGWIAWFAARKAGVPFVTTCHGYYSTHLLSQVMGWGKRVIVISRVIGRHMIEDFHVSQDRIRLIHRGVDLSQFVKKTSVGKTGDHFKIINVGRFSPIKGQVEFLHAVHRLKKQIPHIEAWLVGSEGKGKVKYTAKICQTIDRLGLSSCVKLLGTRRDIPQLLEQADVLVLPTLVPEAFGRVIVEAGAVGIPVIATGMGGVLDIIDHERHGLLVNPGDIEGLSQAMKRILQNPTEAESFAARLHEKVHREFTLEKMTEKTLEVYKEAREEKRILVLKLGAMGDLILTVPSLRMIRKRFPKSRIALVVDRKWAPLVSNCPYVDELIMVDRQKLQKVDYLLKLAKKIRQKGFDISIDFQNSKWTHLLAALAGAPERYGFSRGLFGFLLNRPDHSHAQSAPPVEHQFKILSKLGVRELEPALELWSEPKADQTIEAFMAERGLSQERKKIGLVIGSSSKWPSKRWPIESFQELAEKLLQQFPCEIILIGSQEDHHYGGAYFPEGTDRVWNSLGRTSLEELVALIKKVDLVVTGDTAPLHIAAALHKKIVALFGPTDPKRHMPSSSNAQVFSKNLQCQPCYSGICKNPQDRACLSQISVREVYEAVRRQLWPANAALKTALKD